jgi:signal transduction histidine kinase
MFRRIESKVLALFVFSIILWVAPLGFFFYFVGARSLESQLENNLKTTATVLAAQWDGAVLQLLRPGMEDAPLYHSFYERLNLLKNRAKVEGIYIASADRTCIVSTTAGARIGQPMPRLDLLREQTMEALSGRASASPLVEVEGHLYKSALAPIYSGGRVAAVLMVDMSPWYLVYLESFRNSLLVFTLVGLCFCALTARWFSRTITRPVSRMVESVEEIGKAQFEKPLAVTGSDELAQLAESIENMRRSILLRDAQMKMMLSGIAHEIRNPLGGIELFAGILEKETLSKEQAQYVEKIKTEVAHLKKLLSEFLDFARPQQLNYEELNVGDVMSEVQAMLKEEFRDKDARLDLDVETGTGKLEADRPRLKQAFLNLYRNAFQAIPRGGEVKSTVARNGHGVIVRISNTQSGKLSAESEQKIFEPFFTTREKGMGLGLPLARRIIEAHGGKLQLMENEPQRITFGILLPTGRNHEEAQA